VGRLGPRHPRRGPVAARRPARRARGGLYAGDDRFLHAPHTGAVIGYDALTEPYYSARFAGGRRVTG
jgi:hypothetical protein